MESVTALNDLSTCSTILSISASILSIEFLLLVAFISTAVILSTIAELSPDGILATLSSNTVNLDDTWLSHQIPLAVGVAILIKKIRISS